ncbi:MAG: 2TM domain-containing protein [Ardenticatenaceae bacterium]
MPEAPLERYSEETAREILKRAVDLQVQERDFTREHLQEMAEELGIPPDALARAEASWLAEHEVDEEQRTLEADRLAFEAYRTQGFRTHFAIYTCVITFLFLINLITRGDGGGDWWFFYPLLGWGLGVAIHAWTVYQTTPDEGEFLEWRAERQLKRESLKF